MRTYYPQIDLCLIFRPARTLGSFFRVKDTMPKWLKSRVIYSFSCADCEASYIGRTTRHYKTRVYEHLGISSRTQQPLLSPPFSAIREHCNTVSHKLDRNDFEIICSAKTDYDLSILESLAIANKKPTLNTQLDSNTLKLF